MSYFGNKDYKLVWKQDFDEGELDLNVWSGQFLMGAAKEFKVAEIGTQNIITVSDSLLHLKSICYSDPENPDVKYAVIPTMHTGNSMSFKYGYLEMRARVPFKAGAWPSWWLSSRNTVNGNPKATFSAEIDIFENFGSTNALISNIHKWYNDEDGNKNGVHTQYPKELKKVYRFDENNGLSDGFHIYGLEWTKDYIKMSVDGQVYMTFDISHTFDDNEDMSGFHSPMRIMLNNHLFTESSRWIPSEKHIAKEEDFPMEYDIDYIRIYQIPGEGEINIL